MSLHKTHKAAMVLGATQAGIDGLKAALEAVRSDAGDINGAIEAGELVVPGFSRWGDDGAGGAAGAAVNVANAIESAIATLEAWDVRVMVDRVRTRRDWFGNPITE